MSDSQHQVPEKSSEHGAKATEAQGGSTDSILDMNNPTRVLRYLQRTAGNRAVNQLIRDYKSRQTARLPESSPASMPVSSAVQRSVATTRRATTPVQRHPAGADLVENKDAVVAELHEPGAGPAPAAGAAPGTGTTPDAGTDPGTEAASTAPTAATSDPTPTSSPTDPAPAPAPAGPAPAAPASPQAMSLTAAQTALQAVFGSVHQIVPGNIVLLDGQAPLWAAYDRINLGRTNTRVTPNRPWQNNDAQTYIPGLQGFADNDTNTVYVNKQTALVTATAHEMLHINTATDFRAAVGETVNEGATEYLARKAVTAAGLPLGTVEAYPDQRAIVVQMIGVVGESTLIQSYFGGSSILINAFNLLQGPGKFAQLRPLAEALDAVHAAQLLHPPSAAEKIAKINAILDSWWVSDDDIEAIRSICHANPADLSTISAAIEPRATDLTSIGQRTRLRAILAGA